MEWNVICEGRNSHKIEVFNIFRHNGFYNDVLEAFKKYNDKEKFAEAVRRSLSYYYWSKCEWEVLVSPWIGKRDEHELKIDVYWQVRNNWDAFIDYVWSHRRELKPKRKYYRKCGFCGQRNEQSDMVRTGKSTNGWSCHACFEGLNIEFDGEA